MNIRYPIYEGVYRILTKEEEYRNPLPENIGRFKEAVRIINLLDK